MTQIPSKAMLARNVALSLVLAVGVFVLFVLPAEYGQDPTGLGTLLGIRGMSGGGAGVDVAALARVDHDFIEDSVEFPLAPFESVEYKYALDAGHGMVYSWVAEDEVVFDFHSEKSGAPTSGESEVLSFAAGRSRQDHGSYVAAYAGVHGWFWENRGTRAVVVRLQSRGFFDASITYSASGEYRREFDAD